MTIIDCIEGADVIFHLALFAIGILIGVLAELYIVRHKFLDKQEQK